MTQLPNCETLALAVDGMTLQITLNRPESRNAMSLAMVEELASVFSAIDADPTIRVVCLRGADGHFCAGGDIRDMAGARAESGTADIDPFYRLNRAFGRMIQQVNESSKVVLAVLEGAVMGGGFGLACVSDLALAGPTARFGLPETSLGVIPAQIAPFVVERIGLTQARRLALLGQRFDGEEACRLGVVHQSFATSEDLDMALRAAIEQIRRCAPQATSVTKALLHKVGHQPMADLLDEAAESFAQAIRGLEGAEGTGAFMQKRPPAWAVTDESAPD